MIASGAPIGSPPDGDTTIDGAGIGGRAATVEIAGAPVFVKLVPLTALEDDPGRAPGRIGSTADVFGLPGRCHYGIGSPGFGVWREVAAHTITSEWVREGAAEQFPLLHHWRVLPHTGGALPSELRDVEGVAMRWGAPGMRRRLDGLAGARACVALFLEHVPHTLGSWLRAHLAGDGATAAAAALFVEDQLARGVESMNRRGLLHFDAHFDNVLTDGDRLYFSDFGLAASDTFIRTGEEIDFLTAHSTYDRTYTTTFLFNTLVAALWDLRGQERDAFTVACAAGALPPGTPATIGTVLRRGAPVAAVMNPFYRLLQQDPGGTAYPGHALAALGIT